MEKRTYEVLSMYLDLLPMLAEMLEDPEGFVHRLDLAAKAYKAVEEFKSNEEARSHED